MQEQWSRWGGGCLTWTGMIKQVLQGPDSCKEQDKGEWDKLQFLVLQVPTFWDCVTYVIQTLQGARWVTEVEGGKILLFLFKGAEVSLEEGVGWERNTRWLNGRAERSSKVVSWKVSIRALSACGHLRVNSSLLLPLCTHGSERGLGTHVPCSRASVDRTRPDSFGREYALHFDTNWALVFSESFPSYPGQQRCCWIKNDLWKMHWFQSSDFLAEILSMEAKIFH